jgi:hypothetical protein
MSKKKQETVKVEAMLWDFVYWARFRRPRNKDSYVSKETLECAAQLVEQVLKGDKNPLPKQRGRNPDPDTIWLRFHMVCVFPLTSTDSLPRHLGEGGAFKEVGDRLKIERETAVAHFYKGFNCLKTAKGRQEYITWLNTREIRWAVHKARLENCEPLLHQYVFSSVIKNMICMRSHESGENHILTLSPEEVDSLVNDARERVKTKSGSEDYENWKKYCNQSPLYIRSLKPGRKRK